MTSAHLEPPRRVSLALLTTVVAFAVSGCAGSSGADSHSTATARAGKAGTAGGALTVFAAASLSKVLPEIDPTARYTFGGSDTLEAQIEQGAPADVFVSASQKQVKALFERRLVERPRQFATDRLVLIVPPDDPAHIRSVSDVIRPGVKLVVCNAGVPCGDYARKVLAALGLTVPAMRNVVSQTTDVSQAVAQVALGQADAAFGYVTDVRAAAGRVRAIPLPGKAKPLTKDYVAVVRSSRRVASARALARRLLSTQAQALLRSAGFGPPKG